MKNRRPNIVGMPSKYAGMYRLLRTPRSLKPHNLVSWNIVAAVLAARGEADYYQLAAAVDGHEHGDKAASGSQRFISYCIKSGWLCRVGT